MKRGIDELAILGGNPAFAEPLHVGRPNIGNRERLLARINDILDRRWLSNDGPYVREFEAQIAQLLGIKHVIALCNGTVGLEIAVRAAGLTGEVIVPAMTFVATAHALQGQGIKPVFCDIDPTTHTLDPCAVEALVTPRTTGILGVHLWGRPCHVEALTAIAQRHRLRLLFDAAHAFGCSHHGHMVGNFGDAETLSFHATKFINTFEGGAMVTNDDQIAAQARLMRNFGFVDNDSVVSVGTNAKMNEVSAAMGLTLLEELDNLVATNRRCYHQYVDELSGVPGLRLLTYSEAEQCNYQYIVLEIEAAMTQVDRDQLLQILWAENILARRYFYPGCHRMEPYRSNACYAGLSLPMTEQVCQRVLVLPTGSSVSSAHVREIAQIIRLVIGAGSSVRQRLFN